MNEIKVNQTIGEKFKKEEYLSLKERIAELASLYYDDDAPEVSDHEYDMMMVQLKAAEKKHPEWVESDSITQVIGGTASSKFTKVTHDVPMLSIEDVFDKESVKEWIDKVKSVHPDATFTVEEKIDGLSCTLRYKTFDTEPYDEANCVYYKLVLAETRGNGLIGEDVTENVLQIESIPHKLFLPHGVYGEEFQVRGEIYMPKENFERYNKEHPEKPAANPRNLAAGTLRQKDASLVKERGLSMFIFNVQKVEGANYDILTKTQVDGLFALKKDGFPIVNCQYGENFEDVHVIIDFIESVRSKLSYDIDGAVIKINQKKYQDDFQGTAKYSAGHVAYKYPQTEQKARVMDVDVAIGRTGKLTFTAVVCDDETGLPLQMCGTEVSRVTLHNMDYIRERHIGIGGVYGIIKSGEIIPKLTETVYKEPEKIFEVPEVCPFCGSPIVNLGSTDYFCSNNDCEERAIHQMEYFVGRDQMNIDGLSIETIRFLHDKCFINAWDPSVLYEKAADYETEGDVFETDGGENPLRLSNMPGWSDKSVKNLVDAINKSRNTTFDRVMVSLGLSSIGHGQVKLLKREIEKVIKNAVKNTGSAKTEFDYFEVLMKMYDTGYDFSSIEGFGPVIVKNLTDWIRVYLPAVFDSDDGYEVSFANLYRELNVEKFILDTNTADTSDALAGLTFVITGSVHEYKNRNEFKDSVEARGGKVSGSVSSKTSFLVNNDAESTSGKNKTAKELGIEIISEDEFISRFGK